MKKYLALALLAACAVTSAATYEKPNKAGGQIVLTERQGNCTKNMLTMYATDKDGDTLFGCWGYLDGRVFVIIGEQVNIHSPGSFTKKNEDKPAKPANDPRGM